MNLIYTLVFLSVISFTNVVLSQEKQDSKEDSVVDTSTTAEFPGGDKAMFKFITESIEYPKEALKNKESGIVGVEFMVDTTGAVQEVKINHSQSRSLDQVSIRIIESMPRWKPATENGKKVSARIMLPIKFDLPD